MISQYKNALSTCVIVLICAGASFGQAPPEIKTKLDAEIQQLQSLSTDPAANALRFCRALERIKQHE
jgi:hypothetical protein